MFLILVKLSDLAESTRINKFVKPLHFSAHRNHNAHYESPESYRQPFHPDNFPKWPVQKKSMQLIVLKSPIFPRPALMIPVDFFAFLKNLFVSIKYIFVVIKIGIEHLKKPSVLQFFDKKPEFDP